MTLEKTHKLIAMRPGSGSGYNRTTKKMVLGEVMHDFGLETVDMLTREYDLEKQWKKKPGTKFASAFKS